MPTPPASTTRAACSVASWSSVRTTASSAALTAASRARPSAWLLSSPLCAVSHSPAALAAASRTESMVPGTGSLKADQARIWARFRAAASSGALRRVCPASGSASAHKKTAKSVPEFPRACSMAARPAAARTTPTSLTGSSAVERSDESCGSGADGEVEVGAGVAICHREDVDGVETVAVVPERRLRFAKPPLHGVRIGGNLSLQSDPIPRCQRAFPLSGRRCAVLRQRPGSSLSQ